jgi:hypothetical protein
MDQKDLTLVASSCQQPYSAETLHKPNAEVQVEWCHRHLLDSTLGRKLPECTRAWLRHAQRRARKLPINNDGALASISGTKYHNSSIGSGILCSYRVVSSTVPSSFIRFATSGIPLGPKIEMTTGIGFSSPHKIGEVNRSPGDSTTATFRCKLTSTFSTPALLSMPSPQTHALVNT